ncbi:MAG: zf-HC2 domain-containing protein [Gemmatimonadetes bacterium]|nr:zf-HC2 domain-containing protein [Gemmatimonadota bacterium]
MSTMSCADVVDRLPDWAGGRTSGAEADAVAAHLSACASCAADAALLRALHAARPAAPADLATRIAQAARSGPGVAARPRRLRRIASAWGITGAAAVLAFAVGRVVIYDRGRPVQGPVQSPVQDAALGEVAVETTADAGVWISDDVLVAGAPVLEELSDAEMAALLEEMGG